MPMSKYEPVQTIKIPPCEAEAEEVKAIVSNEILVQDIPPSFGREITDRLTLLNPKWKDNERMSRWNGRTPKFLKCYRWGDEGLSVPRGLLFDIGLLADDHGLSVDWKDRTLMLKPVHFDFKGQLRDYQVTAVSAIMQVRDGVCQAPTGSGKTVIAIYVIAERKQPALIIVHTKELLNQWVDRIHTFLGIPTEEIGVIGAGRKLIGERITIAMVQTLYKCAGEVASKVGHIIVDECHRIPSKTFTEAVTAFNAKYILGLSATPYRRDGLTKLIHWHLGPLVHSIDQAELTAHGDILPFRVKQVRTNFTTRLDASSEYSKTLFELTQDPERNRLVSQEAARQAKNGGGMPLVLSDRKAHCQAIAEALGRDFGIQADVLTGGLSKRARGRVIERLNAGNCKALVATGQLIGEGFDLPALGAVLLATPIKFKGRLLQAIGRALRPAPGQKHATVIDFVDTKVGVLMASAKARARTYREVGAIQ